MRQHVPSDYMANVHCDRLGAQTARQWPHGASSRSSVRPLMLQQINQTITVCGLWSFPSVSCPSGPLTSWCFQLRIILGPIDWQIIGLRILDSLSCWAIDEPYRRRMTSSLRNMEEEKGLEFVESWVYDSQACLHNVKKNGRSSRNYVKELIHLNKPWIKVIGGRNTHANMSRALDCL